MHATKTILALALLTALQGCGPARHDLIASGGVTAAAPPAPPDAAPDPAPEVFEEGGRLVVAGRLHARGSGWPAAVEVTVTGPDGAVLQQATAATARAPSAPTTDRRGLPRGPREASSPGAAYRVEFPAVPPRGSIVSVRRAEERRGG